MTESRADIAELAAGFVEGRTGILGWSVVPLAVWEGHWLRQQFGRHHMLESSHRTMIVVNGPRFPRAENVRTPAYDTCSVHMQQHCGSSHDDVGGEVRMKRWWLYPRAYGWGGWLDTAGRVGCGLFTGARPNRLGTSYEQHGCWNRYSVERSVVGSIIKWRG